MSNPYRGRPAYTYWKQGVGDEASTGVDPVVRAPFSIARGDSVATAGSCFAQHISRTLVKKGFAYLVTEEFAAHPGLADENYGVFPARFGNIYTPRQLLQLFERAYGSRVPQVDFWTGRNGVVDPFRPRIQTGGFGTPEQLHDDRQRHLSAVRQMFEKCGVFIFTLGLTESWVSTLDGSVFPLAPGVVSDEVPSSEYTFRNFGVTDIVDDLSAFFEQLYSVNHSVKVILTVSPVPLIATYEDRHVLVSTVVSKSILRAAVDEICRKDSRLAYFPSYEIVTGPQTGARFYEPDLREVTPDGVSYVMSLFARHYLNAPEISSDHLSDDDELRMQELAAVVCDEEASVQ